MPNGSQKTAQQVLDELGAVGLIKAAKRRGVSPSEYVTQESAQRAGLAQSMLRLPQQALTLATRQIERDQMASERSPTDIVADLLPTILGGGGGAPAQGEVIALPVPPQQGGGGGGINLTALLVLAALGFGAWWLWRKYKERSQ